MKGFQMPLIVIAAIPIWIVLSILVKLLEWCVKLIEFAICLFDKSYRPPPPWFWKDY